MPAIQLARLRIKVAEIAEHFYQPDNFVHHLQHLFEFYADRTRRPTQKGALSPTLKSFNIPQPVFRHLLVELKPIIARDPDAALRLIDSCWVEPIMEYRQLAIHMIALIPPQPIESVLKRLMPWMEETIEESLIQEIFEVGFTRTKTEAQKEYLEIIGKWLNSQDKEQKIFALIGLDTLLKMETFDNLPRIFRLLGTSLETDNKSFRPYYINILSSLFKNSAQESSFFLKELLSNTPTKEILWLARHSLPYFPEKIQDDIKGILRSIR